MRNVLNLCARHRPKCFYVNAFNLLKNSCYLDITISLLLQFSRSEAPLLRGEPFFQPKLPKGKIQLSPLLRRCVFPLRMCIPASSSRLVLLRPPAPGWKQSLAKELRLSPGGWERELTVRGCGGRRWCPVIGRNPADSGGTPGV